MTDGVPDVPEGDASRGEAYDWRCYRHPGREAGVKCRRCERAICPDCMISAPVGFQCPECVKGAPAVRTLRSLRKEAYATLAIIAVNVAVFVPHLSGVDQSRDLGLFGPSVASGEWWRIVTSGFLHFDVLHIGFNMLILWRVGELLEPALGRIRFTVLYAVALLCGSLGVLLLEPNALTGGASGAVFGVMAASVVVMHRRGLDPWRNGFGGLLVINIVLSFRPGISLGGHLGGLVGGALAAAILDATDRAEQRVLGTAVCVGLGALVVGASLWVAGHPV